MGATCCREDAEEAYIPLPRSESIMLINCRWCYAPGGYYCPMGNAEPPKIVEGYVCQRCADEAYTKVMGMVDVALK